MDEDDPMGAEAVTYVHQDRRREIITKGRRKGRGKKGKKGKGDGSD